MTDSGPIQMPEPEPVRPTLAPFLGALVIFVIVLIAIVAFNVFGTQHVTPGQQVANAAVGQNDALQRLDYGKFRNFTCRADQGTEADVLARQRDSVTKNGQRYVDDVPNVTVDGDHGSATVVYHFDKAPEVTARAELSFVQEDGAWKVCAPSNQK